MTTKRSVLIEGQTVNIYGRNKKFRSHHDVSRASLARLLNLLWRICGDTPLKFVDVGFFIIPERF